MISILEQVGSICSIDCQRASREKQASTRVDLSISIALFSHSFVEMLLTTGRESSSSRLEICESEGLNDATKNRQLSRLLKLKRTIPQGGRLTERIEFHRGIRFSLHMRVFYVLHMQVYCILYMHLNLPPGWFTIGSKTQRHGVAE